MINELKRIKVLYEMYNLFNYDKLKYLIPLFRKYGVQKRIYSATSSSSFPEDTIADHPWLDQKDSATALIENPAFLTLNKEVQSAILDWSTNGYAILKGFYSEEKVSLINELLIKLMKDKRMPIKDKRKLMYAVRYSEEMRNLV